MGKRAERKKRIKLILKQRQWENLPVWIDEEPASDKFLLSQLFDPDPLIRWRAIEAIGRLARESARKNDLESVRKIIRNAFWLMNDESGGLLWNGSELIGVILMEVPPLLSEYGRILANFLIEEPFEYGTHWALSHLVKMKPDIFSDNEIINILHESLKDSNPAIRAYGLIILQELNCPVDEKLVEALMEEKSSFTEYDLKTGQFFERTIQDTNFNKNS